MYPTKHVWALGQFTCECHHFEIVMIEKELSKKGTLQYSPITEMALMMVCMIKMKRQFPFRLPTPCVEGKHVTTYVTVKAAAAEGINTTCAAVLGGAQQCSALLNPQSPLYTSKDISHRIKI